MKIRTYTGKTIDVLNPKKEDIDIIDIAHSLSMICRWGGHTKQFYSVAQHSVLVSLLCPDNLQLEGLMHDATEAYIGDLVRPIKNEIEKYKEIEDNLAKVISEKFNLIYPWPEIVVEKDNIVLLQEWNSNLVNGKEDEKLESGVWSQQFSYLMFKTKFEMLKR